MTSTVADAYAGLKTLVLSRLSGEPAGERALQGLEENPEAGRATLRAELQRVGAGDDEQLVVAARELSAMLDARNRKADRYTVDARGAQGVLIGDHGTQNNDFNVPPSPPPDDAGA
ncbi:hypothetical protein [Streptomyces sp. NPDC048473]|uniref:hypothetical protein n=1 Tax=unclassified Streptomyces TaxID=2593676 RepID=UPI00371F43EF